MCVIAGQRQPMPCDDNLFFIMKQFFTLILLLFPIFVAQAQVEQSKQDICTHLQSTGRVEILQDSRLSELVGSQPKAYYVNGGKTADTQSSMGYRIRVFSGNQQTVSKNRCYGIQSNIKEQMPELSTYVTFKTPNWRLSVGDFRTSEEASAMLSQLRKAFPAYAKEMFIVKEKINPDFESSQSVTASETNN